MALIVGAVGEGFDHAALADAAVAALLAHVLEFGTQHREMFDPPVHGGQVTARDRIDLLARLVGLFAHGEQFADCVEIKTEFARMADKAQPRHMPVVVTPLLSLGARRRR
jgi:hypothetical protein